MGTIFYFVRGGCDGTAKRPSSFLSQPVSCPLDILSFLMIFSIWIWVYRS
jgi:hypothetical protein